MFGDCFKFYSLKMLVFFEKIKYGLENMIYLLR